MPYRKKKSVANKVSENTKQYVKDVVKKKLDDDIENKVRNNVVGATAATTITPIGYTHMCAMPQGTANSNRIGQRIRMKQLKLNFLFWIDPAVIPAATTGRMVRLIVGIDRQPNGADPTDTILLANTGANQMWQSQFAVGGKERFMIIRDKSFELNLQSALASPYQQYKAVINLKNRITQYNAGNAGTVADISSGGLFYCVITDGDVLWRAQNQLFYEDA